MDFTIMAALAAAAADSVNSEAVQRTAWDMAQQVATFLVAALTVYGLAVRPAVKALVKHFRETVAEIAVSQAETAKTLQRVEHQVHPNGGRSAHDYARRAYEEAQAIRTEQRHHSKRLDHMQTEQTAQGWRLTELSERQATLGARQVERDARGREALALFRESLASHGIELPTVPGEHDDTEVGT